MKVLRRCGVLAALVLLVCFCGCKRSKPAGLAPAQIHRITQELAKAASEAAPSGAIIKMRRAPGSSAGAGADEIYVRLRGGSPASTDRVRQSVKSMATRRGLSMDPEAGDGNSMRLTFRSHGAITHRVVIERVTAQAQAEKSADSSTGQARLAILLDDLGSDRSAAEAIFALHIPVTISVLPYHTHSREIAEEARKRGCEVMLHLPMQSVANETPEQQELKPGLSAEDVRNTVEKMLDAVPQADGVNNHQGSQATADAALMDKLMQVLKDEGVFYVDSRTTAATVAYDAAKRDGVRTAFRNVPFLDDVQDKGAVKRQLQIAIQGAKQKGEAIAIGHPHLVTLEALREVLPQAKRDGVELVLVSDLVH